MITPPLTARTLDVLLAADAGTVAYLITAGLIHPDGTLTSDGVLLVRQWARAATDTDYSTADRNAA